MATNGPTATVRSSGARALRDELIRERLAYDQVAAVVSALNDR